MSITPPDRDAVLLDACSLINLYATRRIDEILIAETRQCCIVDVVRQESGYVLHGGDGPDANEREPINIQPMEDAGHVTTLSANSEDELFTYIDLRQQMDEGEAMTGAIANHRRLTVVTDDRKALCILNERGVVCETTLDLIKYWVEQAAVPPTELRTVLIDVRRRARYAPHRQHHLREWWDESISG